MGSLNIKKVAIIGGGPGGLTVLNELLHTSKDGRSTIINPSSNNIYPENPAFEEIVVFEQNDKIGGVWNYTSETDLKFPSDIEQYSKPESLRPHLTDPEMEYLEKSDKNNPIRIPLDSNIKTKSKNLWNKSGVYDHLFTNIPNYLMRYSTSFDDKLNLDKNSEVFQPFATHQNVIKYLNNYVEKYHLLKHVRLNTSVEKLYKKNEIWYVSVCEFDKVNNCFNFYTEKFDAVVISIGRFNIPFYPKIEGLSDYNKANPGVLLHSKSFRRTDHLKGKKVLIVGTSVSALDIAQYLIPICDLHISSNTRVILKDEKDNQNGKQSNDWVEKVLGDDELKWKKHGRISKLDGNTVEFSDGSKESDFAEIIFCTGYHLYYPFLDIPENKDKSYISVTSGRDDDSNYALNKVDNLYLYTFTISDPTLCHTGIAQNPLFFLTSEANAIAIAGVWSNNAKLPDIKTQKEFIENRFKGKTSGFQVYNETTIRDFINDCYNLGPIDRFNFLPYVKEGDIQNSKDVLYDLFYKFAKGYLDENDKFLQYDG